MLSKNKIKFINSLSRKKEREESSLFVAEGSKLVQELLPLFRCKLLIATEDFMQSFPSSAVEEVIIATKDEIKKASQLSTPPSVLAVFYQPDYSLETATLKNKLSLMLDTIQDPGNMGTIIRIADWFGIEDIICSEDTVDIYNPKTIQATMGAVGRVRIHYQDLSAILSGMPELPVFGTFLNGDNIYETSLSASGIILMGNEGNGISPSLEKFVTHRLFIPNYPLGKKTSESLNVAVATAITCSEFRRRICP